MIPILRKLIARFRKPKSTDIINWGLPTCEDNVLNRYNLLEKAYHEQAEKLDLELEGSRKEDQPIQIHGNYSVEGHNAGVSEKNYFGELELKNLHGKLYKAYWRIGFGQQVQKGMGILVGDKLALDFYYTEEKQRYYGLVIYKVTPNNSLRGYWIEPGVTGVGFEECSFKNAL